MTMAIITAALLIAVACTSQSLDQTVPKYSRSKSLYHVAVKKASRLISLDPPIELNIPNSRHDYVLFLAALNNISLNLSRSCGGEGDLYNANYYEILDETIPRAWKNPEEYIREFQQLVEVSENITQPVVNIIKKYCSPLRFKDDLDCDTVVDLKVRLNPQKYETAAKTLLALAEVSKIYLENPRVVEANKNGVVPFLLKGKDEIRPLIEALATVRRYLEPPTNLKC